MKKIKHGANLFELERKYNFKIEEVMDFSSNINPLGPSPSALEHLKERLNEVSMYPDTEYVHLKNAISKYSKVSPENIVLGSGTTNLISDYIKIVNPSTSLLLSPCYSEYENELTKINSNILHYNLNYKKDFIVDIEDLINCINTNDVNMFVITNPNNPTGTILKREEIELILQKTKCKVLIDETYIEFTHMDTFGATSLAQKYSNILVVRGTSKFFSTPGIRLGYGVISNEDIKERLQENINLWSINIFADILGQYMFSDEKFINKTFNHIQKEKDKMILELSKIKDLKVFPSYGNFVLCKILKEKVTAADLREYLLHKKMIIRDCSNFVNLDESFFRFCILETKANDLLVEGIKEYFK